MKTVLFMAKIIVIGLNAISYATENQCTSDWWDIKQLHELARWGDSAEIGQFIDNKGIYVDCIYDDLTALYVAARSGKSKNVKKLLDLGANPNWRYYKSGRTPLHAAIQLGNFETVKALVDDGADIFILNINGSSLLHQACMAAKYTSVIEFLLQFNLDIHLKNKDGTTPIIYSGSSSDPVIPKMLLDKGANPNDIDEYGYTALLYAAERGNFETAKVLVEHGAEINTVGVDSNTAITMACKKLNYNIALMLLKNGADPFKKNGAGKSAFDYINAHNAIMTEPERQEWDPSEFTCEKQRSEFKARVEKSYQYSLNEYKKEKALLEEMFALIEEYEKENGK